MRTGGGWILEVDIRKFFDTLDHAHLRELLQHRVRDGVLLRLIGKRLNAGVLEDGPGTFSLLGFTHYWGRSRKGTWVLKRQTAANRFTRALRTITPWCRLHRHEPVAQQHHTLSRKLRGHFAYYGITGNYDTLSRFRYAVTRVWRKWLGRRKRAGPISWSRFAQLLERYPLPAAVVVHSVYRAEQNCNLRNRMR